MFRNIGILRRQKSVPQNEQSGACNPEAVSKRLLEEDIHNAECQTEDWSDATEIMKEYAKHEVILLRKLIWYAMQKENCSPFIELKELADERLRIHESNTNDFDLLKQIALWNKRQLRFVHNRCREERN